MICGVSTGVRDIRMHLAFDMYRVILQLFSFARAGVSVRLSRITALRAKRCYEHVEHIAQSLHAISL